MTKYSESEYLITIFLLDYDFSCLILFLDLHFGEIILKKKIGLLFFIFFIKKSPIIFILFYEIFNFLVNSLKSIIKSKWNNYFPLDSILSRRVWKCISSKPSRIRGGPYIISPRRNINIALLPNYAVGKSYNGN